MRFVPHSSRRIHLNNTKRALLANPLAPLGIDLVAGGKVKKSKRTAPKSNDIYLKLLVKVSPQNPLFIFVYLRMFG
nr:60s ribosomal protein l18-3 [Quercus suber]